MTTNDLVERLRELSEYLADEHLTGSDVASKAAVRIEELERERDNEYGGALVKQHRRITALEARLAIAEEVVQAARSISEVNHLGDEINQHRCDWRCDEYEAVSEIGEKPWAPCVGRKLRDALAAYDAAKEKPTVHTREECEGMEPHAHTHMNVEEKP